MKRLVAIDFETANAMPESACAVGAIVFEDGVELDHFSTLIKPPAPYDRFDARNVQIHHITAQDVADAPGLITVWEWLRPYFKDAVFVAHNADFDMMVLARGCRVCQLPVPDLSYFCTVQLTRRMFPFLPHHRLNDCCEYMGIELDHHQALSDAQGCAQIVLNCMVLAGKTDLESFLSECLVTVKKLSEKFPTE